MIFDEIKQVKDHLPRQQRLLCEYILSNPVEASTLTINEMSKRANVGITTILRMVKSLGFDRYNQLKAALRNTVFEQKATSYLVYRDAVISGGQPENDLLSIIDFCAEELATLKRPDFLQQVKLSAELIVRAKRVYLLGLRMSVSTSTLMAHTLRNYGVDVRLLSGEADFVIDRTCELQEDDLLICFANSPVAKTTADAMRVCHGLGRQLLVITGGLKPELAQLATLVVDTRIPRRPSTIMATVLTMELISMELSQQLDRLGLSDHKTQTERVESIAEKNHIALLE